MNFSHFFIRRPIFAGVLSSVIFIVGLIAMWRLPISEYPEVVPPTIVVHLFSPNGRYDEVYLRNYATLQVKDVLARIPGAGDVEVFGSGDYAMRVWLNPDKIAARNLTASDVVSAIREQNVQVAAGAIGQQPVSSPVNFELQINGKGRLISA